MFCSKCGCENREDAKFCKKCGSLLLQEKDEEQFNNQDILTKSEEISFKKKTKKKVTIAIVSVIVIIATVIITESIFIRCQDCGKWIPTFFVCYREDGESSMAGVCKNCFDAYYYNITYGNDSSVGGYELDDVITAVMNMVCTNDINRISAYTHPYAEAFGEYCYSNFSEDESAYVDCHMEVKNSIEKLKEDDIFFLEDTKCVLDQVYYSPEDVAPVISELESFFESEGISESIEDYAFVEFDVENSDCSINLGVVMVQTKTGWFLLAIDT